MWIIQSYRRNWLIVTFQTFFCLIITNYFLSLVNTWKCYTQPINKQAVVRSKKGRIIDKIKFIRSYFGHQDSNIVPWLINEATAWKDFKILLGEYLSCKQPSREMFAQQGMKFVRFRIASPAGWNWCASEDLTLPRSALFSSRGHVKPDLLRLECTPGAARDTDAHSLERMCWALLNYLFVRALIRK